MYCIRLVAATYRTDVLIVYFIICRDFDSIDLCDTFCVHLPLTLLLKRSSSIHDSNQLKMNESKREALFRKLDKRHEDHLAAKEQRSKEASEQDESKETLTKLLGWVSDLNSSIEFEMENSDKENSQQTEMSRNKSSFNQGNLQQTEM